MALRDLSRRRFLRGAFAGSSVSIALPRLSVLLDQRGEAWAATGSRPIRYVTFGFGNGVVTSRWNPKSYGQGAAFVLNESMLPFQDIKSHLTVVTGVDVAGAGSHGTGNLVYLSGVETYRTTGAKMATLDQVIAGQTKAMTPIKSLEVGIVDNQDDRTLGHLYWSHNGPGSPNPPSYDPAAVFGRLFGMGAPTATTDPVAAKAAENLRTMRKSVLDFVLEDSTRLRADLPAADKARLDQHLDGVRALEKRLQTQPASGSATGGCTKPASGAFPKVPLPTSINAATEVNKSMAKLVALAFACDLTRVVTYQTTQAASRANWPDKGISNWHGTSHDGTEAGQAKIQSVVMKHMEWLRLLVDELKNTPDGAGNLLDNSAILTVNEVGQGWTHQSTEMPTLIIGKAGGGLKGDVAVQGQSIWCGRVCLTVAHAVGVKLPQFGSGGRVQTNPLTEVLA